MSGYSPRAGSATGAPATVSQPRAGASESSHGRQPGASRWRRCPSVPEPRQGRLKRGTWYDVHGPGWAALWLARKRFLADATKTSCVPVSTPPGNGQMKEELRKNLVRLIVGGIAYGGLLATLWLAHVSNIFVPLLLGAGICGAIVGGGPRGARLLAGATPTAIVLLSSQLSYPDNELEREAPEVFGLLAIATMVFCAGVGGAVISRRLSHATKGKDEQEGNSRREFQKGIQKGIQGIPGIPGEFRNSANSANSEFRNSGDTILNEFRLNSGDRIPTEFRGHHTK